MGGSRKQTVGHRYYIGLHMVLCRQADALLEIKMAAKEAWRGSLAGGRGTFNKPSLFGGDEREGGISGAFDFLRGENTQPVNDYLASVLGALTPAYRGVVSMVFRKPYIGANTARLPNMQFKLMNTAGIHRGWYPEKAVLADVSLSGEASVYIAWNVPGVTTAGQLAGMKEWLVAVLGSFVGTGTPVYIKRFGVETDDNFETNGTTDYSDAIEWVNATTVPIDPGGQSDWGLAFSSQTTTFFQSYYDGGAGFPTGALAEGLGTSFANVSSESQLDGRRNVVILLGLQNPIPAGITATQDLFATIPNLEVFAFRVDSSDVTTYALIDNTPIDGIPTVNSADPQPAAFINQGLLVGWADMNPAHIIRCLWTDPMRGGIATDAEIGDSFTAAADLFYAERLGLSPRFQGTGAVEADRLQVERHADCISFRSRLTGKIEIKPIRNDYNPIDLPVLDSGIVLEWGNLEREIASETPNQLTVVYTKRENGDPGSVTRTNIAGVRRSGRVIPAEPVEYPACTTEALATRLCLRDLSVQVRPLLSGTLVLSYFPPELDIGEPFILNEPKLKIDNVVVRIVEVQEGDGRDNSVTVKVTEDRYAIPDGAALGPPSTPPGAASPAAEPSPLRVVQEAPYYLAVLDQGQAAIDQALTDEPDLGLLLATGIRANAAQRDITVGVDEGAGYVEAGTVEFVAATITLSSLSAAGDDTLVTVPTSPALFGITANSLALIENEIVRIDSMVANGSDVDLIIGRGCLDTVPAAHLASTSLIFLQNADPLEQQYLAGELVDVKLLTNLTSRRLSLFTAPVDTVTFDSRAIRPYPPGNLRIGTSLAQDQFVADVVLNWSHRDRTLQTTPVPEDHTAGNIGPEAGTTYRVRAEALDENNNILATVTNVNVGAVTTYDWVDTTALPAGTNRVRFTLASERGGYESWQRSAITAAVLFSPSGLTLQEVAGDVQIDWTDMNSGPMQEDDFVIYRDTAPLRLATLPAILATLAADTETYTDTTVAPATTYYYAVVARRGARVAARFADPITTT